MFVIKRYRALNNIYIYISYRALNMTSTMDFYAGRTQVNPRCKPKNRAKFAPGSLGALPTYDSYVPKGPKYLYGTKYGFCSSNFPYGLGKYSLYRYLGPFGCSIIYLQYDPENKVLKQPGPFLLVPWLLEVPRKLYWPSFTCLGLAQRAAPGCARWYPSFDYPQRA